MLTEQGIEPVFEMINGTDMPRFLVQNIAQAQEMLEASTSCFKNAIRLLSYGNDG
jgi:hydroxypyruvate isomerase